MFNAGTAYYKPTKHTVSLLEEWIKNVRGKEKEAFDQVILNDIITSKRIAGLIVKVLSQENFPNGQTFYRFKQKCMNDTSKVAVFHATWSGGHDQKKRLFKRCLIWLRN